MEQITNVIQYVRAYTEPDNIKEHKQQLGNTEAETFPEYLLVFDTETTTDVAQKLRFGVYKVLRADKADYSKLQEGLLWPSQVIYRELHRGVFYNLDVLTDSETT